MHDILATDARPLNACRWASSAPSKALEGINARLRWRLSRPEVACRQPDAAEDVVAMPAQPPQLSRTMAPPPEIRRPPPMVPAEVDRPVHRHPAEGLSRSRLFRRLSSCVRRVGQPPHCHCGDIAAIVYLGLGFRDDELRQRRDAQASRKAGRRQDRYPGPRSCRDRIDFWTVVGVLSETKQLSGNKAIARCWPPRPSACPGW